ncbi:GlsB/YeaQ/YmgE family stress response membrane protein, partial [Streptomyces pathocidini]
MGWLWAIIVGLVLGLIAKAILPGKQNIPICLTII